MRQINIQTYPASLVKQDQYPSIAAAFEHFRQTGESVFDSKPSNSYDFGTDVDITKADLDNVQKDTTLLDAYLLNHGESSRQELNKDKTDVKFDLKTDVKTDVTS